LPMNEVIEAYKKAKYGALAISNHNKYIPQENEYSGINILDAVEYSKHPHMLQIGVRDYEDISHQDAIDHTVDKGGFVILCHPNWINKGYWDWDKLGQLDKYTGIEILNPVIYTLKGSGLALDTWDYLLSKGKKVFGFGNDDFHQWRDLERSYNVIYAKSNSFQDIKEAVQKGCFYVSDGVALSDFAFDGKTVTVKAGLFVETYVEEYEYKFIGLNGIELYKCQGKSASFDIDINEPYVRIEATAEHGAKMYLQPLFNCRYFPRF
ncbi:MAG TPA: hypothetical protein PK733_16465, partial [Clostridiales bacterium]|nr:hypothetical protein [Clostridiales bacterium]